LACHLQIDADQDPAYHFDPDPSCHFDADPDAGPDPTFQVDAVHADPDPQHCWEDCSTCFMPFSYYLLFILKFLQWCGAYYLIAASYLGLKINAHFVSGEHPFCKQVRHQGWCT
jgi:hypothetical protein